MSSRHTFRNHTLTIDTSGRTMAVTLTRAASRKWGAYLPEGHDSPDAQEFRTALRRDLLELAEDRNERGGAEEITAVEVYVRPPRGGGHQDWIADQIEVR